MGRSCRTLQVTETLEFGLSERGSIKGQEGQELTSVLRFPSGCCAENRLKEDRETSEGVIIQAKVRPMVATEMVPSGQIRGMF